MQRPDQLRDLAARRDRGYHVGAVPLGVHEVPVEHDVLEIEGQGVLHLEGHGLLEAPALREGEGEAPHGHAVSAQGGDHVVGREPVHLHEALHQRGELEVALAHHRVYVHRLEGAPALLQLHGLHAVAAQVESENVL